MIDFILSALAGIVIGAIAIALIGFIYELVMTIKEEMAWKRRRKNGRKD